LVLDGVIQITDRDEMAYQEMITHLPMFSHPNPERVLVVGGGDGGVLREVCRHDSVKHVTICEIDKVVIEAGKKYFPTIATAWNDKRVNLVCGDAAVYMQKPEVEGTFDVIICDSSDPIGPAQALFESPFYQAMFKALKPGGRICVQAESMWMHLDLIEKLVRESSQIFDSVEYGHTQIPTYPCGQIGLMVCGKAGGKSKKLTASPVRKPSAELQDKLRFYTPELHEASFVMPKFCADRITKAKQAAVQAIEKASETKSTTIKTKRGKPAESAKPETPAATTDQSKSDTANKQDDAEDTQQSGQGKRRKTRK